MGCFSKFYKQIKCADTGHTSINTSMHNKSKPYITKDQPFRKYAAQKMDHKEITTMMIRFSWQNYMHQRNSDPAHNSQGI